MYRRSGYVASSKLSSAAFGVLSPSNTATLPGRTAEGRAGLLIPVMKDHPLIPIQDLVLDRGGSQYVHMHVKICICIVVCIKEREV